jgi:uncharacterized protein YutD
MIIAGNRSYELVTNFRDGWNQEAFRQRYSDVLERYDFIVGDWGYNQLRLRGFFKETNPKATRETSAVSIKDYIQEYCNFGCRYFIVEKTGEAPVTIQEETEA